MIAINDLRKLHGQLNELITPQKGYWKSLLENNKSKIDYPIDIVVAWVDGKDDVWRKEKAKYQTDGQKAGNGDARYRDWDMFQYWFRAIETYAPWVNKVYLLTYGHIPTWLNLDYSKLKVVNHKDFIPEDYLPTFSSIPIELNMWRIPELSEHFIYFNDDMFLSQPVKPEDFYFKDLPKYSCVALPLPYYTNSDYHVHQLFGDLGVVNHFFNIKQCIIAHPEKWFSKQYKKHIKFNKRVLKDGVLTGMEFTHLACPYRKSTCEKVWNDIPQKMHETCLHKFRTPTDIMHQIFQLWEICNGTFQPVPAYYYGDRQWLYHVCSEWDDICSIFQNKSKMMVCINDNENDNNDELRIAINKIIKVLQETFPDISKFEKQSILQSGCDKTD